MFLLKFRISYRTRCCADTIFSLTFPELENITIIMAYMFDFVTLLSKKRSKNVPRIHTARKPTERKTFFFGKTLVFFDLTKVLPLISIYLFEKIKKKD